MFVRYSRESAYLPSRHLNRGTTTAQKSTSISLTVHFERTIVLQIPRILLASPPTLRLLIAISPGAEAEAYAGDIDVVIIVVLAHPAPTIEAACDKNDLRRNEFQADGSV